MKKEWFVLWAMMFALGLVSCKRVNVPQKVEKAFEQKFANAEKPEWEEEEKNMWEVEFELNGQEMSATFDNNGKWLQTETEIETKDVPQEVLKAVEGKFAGYKAVEWERIDLREQTAYEAKLKGENGEKMRVLFDKTGKGLKRERL